MTPPAPEQPKPEKPVVPPVTPEKPSPSPEQPKPEQPERKVIIHTAADTTTADADKVQATGKHTAERGTNAPVTLGLLGLGVLAAVASVIARRKAKNA